MYDRPMRAGVLVMVTALGAAGLLRAQPALPAFVAADEGTRLRPIAQRAGNVWAPIPPAAIPRTPRDWIRWNRFGGSVPLRVSAVDPAGRCSSPSTLPIATPPAAARGRAGASSVGLAIAGTVQLDGLARVTTGSREWPAVAAALGPIFDQRAHEPGVSAPALDRVPMTIDSVYAATRPGGTPVYYFEMSKRVPDAGNTPDEDPKGVVRIVVSGWLRREGGRLVPAGTRSELHWDPAEPRAAPPAPTLTPLGVLRHDNEAIWVMEGLMGVRGTFTLYALGAARVRALFSVDAGEC